MTTLITIGSTTIEPDACVSRTLEVTAEATQWPIEDRSSVSDHVIIHPLTMSLELSFAPNPVRPTAGPAPGETRPMRAYSILRDALQLRQPVEVGTPDGAVVSLVLTSVSSPRVAEDGYTRRISVQAQQIAKVTSQEAEVPVARRSAALKPRSAAQDAGTALVRAAVAAEVARSVFTLTPNTAALQASAALVARTSGTLFDETQSEVARLLGVKASLVVP